MIIVHFVKVLVGTALNAGKWLNGEFYVMYILPQQKHSYGRGYRIITGWIGRFNALRNLSPRFLTAHPLSGNPCLDKGETE